MQLQRTEDNSSDVLEFDRLKDHFDPYLKAQNQAAITSASVGSASSSRSASKFAASASNGSSSAPSAATSIRNARANAARNAATAALQSSKLVHNLARSKHLAGTSLATSTRSAPIEPDELKRYRALNPWQPPHQRDSRNSSSSSSTSSMGVVAKREKHRKDYLTRIQSAPSQPAASLDDKIASLEQRWSSVSIADQPIRAAELRPTRVPLKSKLSKRCPACRHIVIKPDSKADSSRFKIKLVAINFLPEVQVHLAPHQPYLDPLSFRTTATSGLNTAGSGAAAASLRRRPFSTLTSHAQSGGTDSVGTLSSMLAGPQDIDVNNLAAGQTYSFEITITNPLDDPVHVDMSFVRFAAPSQSRRSAPAAASEANQSGMVPALPEPKYGFSSKQSQKPLVPPATETSSETSSPHGGNPSYTATRSRFGWQVYPSATSVPLNAFNEVWELEESEALYSSKTESDERDTNAFSEQETPQRRFAVKTALVRGPDGSASSDEAAYVFQEEDDVEEDDAYDDSGRNVRRRPFVQKGHTTLLYLDLAISSKDPPKPGPLELAMHVTYRYSSGAGQDGNSGSSVGKDFSFWTSIRFGTFTGRT